MPEIVFENKLQSVPESQLIDAAARRLSAALSNSIEAGSPLEIAEVVELIKAIPPDPNSIRRRRTDRSQWELQPREADLQFDENAWRQEWSQIEAEIDRLAD